MTDRTPRKVLYRGGQRGDQVKAVADERRHQVIVYYRDANRAPATKCFPLDAEGKRAAKAWAAAFHQERERLEQARREGRAEGRPITHRELWEAYVASPAWLNLRETSRTNYGPRWRKWERFRGAASYPNATTLHHVDQFIVACRETKMAINQVRQVLNIARTVYNWGQSRKLVQTNELALYRWQRPKDTQVLEPEEYTEAEYVALLRQLSPQDAGTWRAWVALMLAGHHGQRANAVLHLRWCDIGEHDIVWPKRYQKNGEDHVQPLTWDAVAALETARYWLGRPVGRAWTRMNRRQRARAEELARSPWVLPSTSPARRSQGKPWTYQALWRALRAAEDAARVAHKPYRALHGFRRMVAGDVADRTGDARLAMEWIGDDIAQARAYLKRRSARLERAAGAVTTTSSEATS